MAGVVVELTGDEAKLLRSMQKIIEQNSKVGDSFGKLGKDGKKASDVIASSFDVGAKSVASMVTGVSAVAVGIEVLSDVQQKWSEQMKESLILVRELASAQQEASKNLAGNEGKKISEALQKKVPEIATNASFSDLSKLTTALGSVVSIVGEESASGIVDVAAKLTRNKKDELQTTATALADITKVSGIDDPKKVVALALSSGSIARPEQMSKLAQGMSKSIASGIASNPNQDKIEASKASAALFALFTELDPEGQRGSNATASIEGQLNSFFNPNRDDTAKRDERIAELLKEMAITTEEQVAIDRASFNVQQKELVASRVDPNDMRPGAQDIRLDLAEAKASLVSAKKSAVLSDKESDELKRLQAVKGAIGKDPGNTIGRMESIATSPELSRAFEASLHIEEIFKPITKGLMDINSDYFKKFKKNLEVVTTETSVFDEGMKSLTTTPQQILALSIEKSATANSVKNFKDIETQTYATVDEIVQKALKDNPNTGVNALTESLSGVLYRLITIGQGSTEPSVSSTAMNTEQAINSAILTLKDRQVDVGDWATGDRGKMSKPARDKIESLQGSIDALEQMAKSLAEQNELMKQQNKLIENGNDKVEKQTEVLKDSNGPNAPDKNAIRAQVQQRVNQ